MNKMAKGALAIGVGAALLLGGGGTLAIWNDTESANAGVINAGELSVATAADGAGKWTNLQGDKVDLLNYKVVPGDVLTYTQTLDVKLAGDLMKATLTMSDPNFTAGGFDKADVDVETPTLKKTDDGTALPATLTPANSGKVTATAKFTFKETGVTQKLTSANAAATFGTVTFQLNQVAPSATK